MHARIRTVAALVAVGAALAAACTSPADGASQRTTGAAAFAATVATTTTEAPATTAPATAAAPDTASEASTTPDASTTSDASTTPDASDETTTIEPDTYDETTSIAPDTDSEPEQAAVATPDPDGVGDRFYPKLGNPGYDALHYDIELAVDTVAGTISARTALTAQATEELAWFNLDLLGLDVASVTVDGAAAAFARSGHELIIKPEIPPAAGSQFEVAVEYSGSPEAIDDPGVPFFAVGWQQAEGVIYTVSEPSGSMTWFPSNNHPTDKATYEIRITVPEGLTAASNGLLVDETTAAGRTTYTWRTDDPMATYLAAVYIGDFDRIDHGPLYEDGPLLRDYVPSDSTPETAAALSVTPEAIRFLEDLLGPYPFDAYGTIVMPFMLGFALENQTLSVHGPATIGPGIIAHEIAHQWLGNSVTLEDWSDIWLNEGFATYLHLMFEAEHFGMDFDETMTGVYAQLVALGEVPPKGIDIAELFGPSVYFRGAMTLHALRRHAGDETFFEILRAHYDRSAGGHTSTEGFLELVAELAGADAAALVETWLFDETVPSTL